MGEQSCELPLSNRATPKSAASSRRCAPSRWSVSPTGPTASRTGSRRTCSVHGYRIIPVNPAVAELLGERATRTSPPIPAAVAIDVVDIFRKPEFIPAVVDEAIARRRAGRVDAARPRRTRPPHEKARAAGLDCRDGPLHQGGARPPGGDGRAGEPCRGAPRRSRPPLTTACSDSPLLYSAGSAPGLGQAGRGPPKYEEEVIADDRDRTRINEMIRLSPVRLIDADGSSGRHRPRRRSPRARPHARPRPGRGCAHRTPHRLQDHGLGEVPLRAGEEGAAGAPQGAPDRGQGGQVPARRGGPRLPHQALAW